MNRSAAVTPASRPGLPAGASGIVAEIESACALVQAGANDVASPRFVAVALARTDFVAGRTPDVGELDPARRRFLVKRVGAHLAATDGRDGFGDPGQAQGRRGGEAPMFLDSRMAQDAGRRSRAGRRTCGDGRR